MRTRNIGSLTVSVIALGCNNFGGGYEQERVDEVVHAALDAGITFFDTAESYGEGMSESVVGKALGTRRADVVLGTKYTGTPGEVADHVDKSLDRLGTDWIDIYTLHHPVPDVPIAETLGALTELQAQGKIREFGCSNVNREQLRDALSAVGEGRNGFVSVQNDYNLLNRKAEFEVIPECERMGLAFTCYFPIYHGFLTGAFHRNQPFPEGTRLTTASEARKAAVFTDAHFDVLEGIERVAQVAGHSVLDVALARLLAEPGVTAVLPGAASAAHVRANAGAGDWELTPEEVAAVDVAAPSDPDSAPTPSTLTGFAP
jgi:aryl-alcohol dehydrogenase-like predicted oxidoreductase